MLVLLRAKDESVVVSTVEGPIEIMVLDIKEGKVRLGFVAPRNIPIHRKEIHLQLEKEKEGAKNGTKSNMSSSTH